jgi:cytosine/creatinine deaminase
MTIDHFMTIAIDEAKKGLSEGGIPIGSVLVCNGTIIGQGHNQRIQKQSPILHAEMDCLENAGRLSAADYKNSVLYTTLSPCDMCSGTILLYGIPTVIIGENETFKGPEKYLKSRGVNLVVVDSDECKELMKTFITKNPTLWNEDIGV